jgi:hypothetical protein
MKVRARQQVLLPGKYPSLAIGTLAFGTMPVAAGIVGYPFMGTGIAPVDMAAETGCAAMLNGMENAQVTLQHRMMSGEGCQVFFDDLSQLKDWPSHHRP